MQSKLDPPWLNMHTDLHASLRLAWISKGTVLQGQSSRWNYRCIRDVVRSPPADSPPRDRLITMVKEKVNKVSKNEKT